MLIALSRCAALIEESEKMTNRSLDGDLFYSLCL